ncbi:hypothetical protein Tsubulata_005820, partial [Turnera subulata]
KEGYTHPLLLVVKLWTERSFNGKAFMQTISSLWSVKGLQISELEKNLFMFRFRDAMDEDKILAGEPWHFDRQVLVLKSIEGYEQPSSIELHTTPFWVQIRDLPFDYRDLDIAEVIRRRLGSVMEVYQDDEWELLSFMRVRVGLDLQEPLRSTLSISINETVSFKVVFKRGCAKVQ